MNFLQNLALSYSHKAMQKSLENGFDVKLLKNGQEKK